MGADRWEEDPAFEEIPLASSLRQSTADLSCGRWLFEDILHLESRGCLADLAVIAEFKF